MPTLAHLKVALLCSSFRDLQRVVVNLGTEMLVLVMGEGGCGNGGIPGGVW